MKSTLLLALLCFTLSLLLRMSTSNFESPTEVRLARPEAPTSLARALPPHSDKKAPTRAHILTFFRVRKTKIHEFFRVRGTLDSILSPSVGTRLPHFLDLAPTNKLGWEGGGGV